MNTTFLQTSWLKAWNSIQAQSDGLQLMQRLIAAYEEPHRRYHTLQHLTECLALLDEHQALASEPGEVGIALWFHDSVYDTRATANEAASAEWAATELTEAAVSAERIERIRQHILATRHTEPPEGTDQMLLVDIDLAILGAARSRFMEYEMQVRAEYGWVPDGIYREKRSTLLRGLLARAPLYNTPKLRAILEVQARVNLAQLLRLLDPQGKAARTRYGPCR